MDQRLDDCRLGSIGGAESGKLLQVLAKMRMALFIDSSDQDARDFSHAALEKVGIMKLLWKTMQIVDNFAE